MFGRAHLPRRLSLTASIAVALLLFASGAAALRIPSINNDENQLASNYAQDLPLNVDAPQTDDTSNKLSLSEDPEEEEPYVSAPIPDVADLPRFAETPHFEIQPKLRPRHSTMLPPPRPKAKKSQSSVSASMPPALRPSPPLTKNQPAAQARETEELVKTERAVLRDDTANARDEPESNAAQLDEPETRGQAAPEEKLNAGVSDPFQRSSAYPPAQTQGAAAQESVLDLDSLQNTDGQDSEAEQEQEENDQDEQNAESDENSDDSDAYHEQASDDSEQGSDESDVEQEAEAEREEDRENAGDGENEQEEEDSDPRPALLPPRWGGMEDI